MKKRTKILAIVAAAALAVGTMCFGFAAWSTQVDLNGTVSANGKWDLAVTDASITLSNNGAAFGTTTSEGTVTYNSFYDDGYAYGISDSDITKAYNANLEKPTYFLRDVLRAIMADGVDLNDIHDETKTAWIGEFSYLGTTEEGSFGSIEYYTIYDGLMYETSDEAKAAANDISKGYSMVTGVAGSIQVEYFVVTYPGTKTTESQTTWTDTSVQYADVVFSLPGAWAQYSVTITNNGTADATLTANDFDFSALDENIYEEVTPEFDEEVIAAGESCTFTFNVQIKEDVEDLTAEAASFNITLNYGANVDVDEAPDVAHNHN